MHTYTPPTVVPHPGESPLTLTVDPDSVTVIATKNQTLLCQANNTAKYVGQQL